MFDILPVVPQSTTDQMSPTNAADPNKFPALTHLMVGFLWLLRFVAHSLTFRRWRWQAAIRMRLASTKPQDFNEKLRYKMAYDRRPILKTITDKYAARKFVKEMVGADVLSEIYAVADCPAEVDWSSLPREYVVKVNHGSGGVIVVSELADPTEELPVVGTGWSRHLIHPDRADLTRMSDLLTFWLSLDYSWSPGSRSIEWGYEGIKPIILVEELLKDKQGNPPNDYKFFVFNGVVRFIQAHVQNDGGKLIAMFDPTWRPIPVKWEYAQPAVLPNRPHNFDEMLQFATVLGEKLGDFIRVDLYDLGSRVVLGELTSYPTAGNAVVEPPSFLLECGNYWHQDYESAP